MEPIDQESISQEENKIKKKFLHDFNKNFTQNQIGEAQKQEVVLQSSSMKIPESFETPEQELNKEKSFPNIYIDMSDAIKRRKLGLTRIVGDSIKIHFPEDKTNYFQQKEDNKTFEEDPHLLSDNVKYLYKNFTAMNLSTKFTPISTDNLNNGEAHKILKLKYDLEQEKYDDESNSFWEMQKEKKYNNMMSDYQKVLNRKKEYPLTEISGMEFGKYDPIRDIRKIQTTFNS